MRRLFLFALLAFPATSSWALSVEDIDASEAEFDPEAAVRNAAKKEAASVDFHAKWDSSCKLYDDLCPAKNRSPKTLIKWNVGKLPGGTGHGRKEYYDRLKTLNIIDGKVADLRASQNARVEQMTRQIKANELESALAEARELVAQARRQREFARADERRRRSEMARCQDEMHDFVNQACAGFSPAMRRYLRASECYSKNSDGPWVVLGPPSMIVPTIGCPNDMLASLQHYADAPEGVLANVVRNVREKTALKSRGCSSEMRRIAAAACEAAGSLTSDDLDMFYQASYCRQVYETSPTAALAPRSCAAQLEETLALKRCSVDDANRLAHDIRRSYDSTAAPEAPPPAQDIDPDPPRGGGRGRGGRCEDYGNLRCPK